MLDNCFAKYKDKCQILNIGKCTGHDKCSFFKTKKQYGEGFEKVYQRISSLDASTQATIADQYYNGKYPWKE